MLAPALKLDEHLLRLAYPPRCRSALEAFTISLAMLDGSKFSADCGGKGVADIKEGASLERRREHIHVLEVNHPEMFSRIVPADVGMVDG